MARLDILGTECDFPGIPNSTPPTVELLIKVPVDLDSLYVAPGTKITTHGITFLCVVQDSTTPRHGEDIPALCAGCDAEGPLCRIMRCSARQRPDRTNVLFKVIARYE